MNFASENYDGVHPRILKAVIKSNKGFVPSYGADNYTEKTIAKFAEILGAKDIDVFFCFNGTGANNFALSSISEKHASILCSDVAHIYNAESTAPEAFTGCRLFPVKSKDGKIMMEDLILQLSRTKDVHFPFPSTLTISQPTEHGTIYNIQELKQISKLCKQHRLLLHIDGARIFNALSAMNCSLSDFIKLSSVDALTIGGTKSGLMFGEAVVFFKNHRFKNLRYNHKRSMQLASKNRFIAVQFEELLKKEFWKTIAAYTNGLAKYFEQQIKKTGASQIVYTVETNTVFLYMKKDLFLKLKSTAEFYLWDEQLEIARFVFSFSNTRKEIDNFLIEYKRILRSI
ncbi:MAG: aminotransferase class V-fold PLP-dependent enzyme [Bacteroidetes bacterium]|nr:aminotransferase class V-fold PLP-dependent enzyme [Bacteroidota bacterium]